MSSSHLIQSGDLTIEASEIDGRTYYETTARGVAYTISRDRFGRGWEVYSQRISLRAARMGGTVRYFADLHALSQKVKALRGIGFAIGAA